jgi:hypothetical protein
MAAEQVKERTYADKARLARELLRLQNHAARGITDKDFELAKKIEDVILWQPTKGGALEGTPANPRFA